MAKVLVTGGAGFIGSHLVDRLVDDGHQVKIIDNISSGKRENLNSNAELIEADIADYEKIAPHFQGVEAVFHLAAQARIQPSIKNPLPANSSNIDGTLNVLWAAKNAGAKKVVYSGSSSVYGDQDTVPLTEDMRPNPKNPYAVQKLVGEQYAKMFFQLYGLPTVTLRYFNVHGPRQLSSGAYATVMGIFLEQVKRGEPMTIVGDGHRRRDYTYVSDVVEANILAWQTDLKDYEVFNVGTGKNYSVNEVAALVGGDTVNTEDRPGEAEVTLADNSKAKKLLGWEPKVSLEEGIELSRGST